MNKSDSIKELATALAKFQGMMKPIAKDASNPFFKSKYASLSAIIEDTKEPLVKCGLSYAQFPDETDGLTTILMHTSGEWITATYNISPVGEMAKDERGAILKYGDGQPVFKEPTPQAIGSAITYARRYALQSILGLQVDDDDGNEASKPKAKYDKAPIEDDAPVYSSEDDAFAEATTPKTKVVAAKKSGYVSFTEKKRTIKDLVDGLSLIDLDSKEEYESYVKENTGLELLAPNYDAIIKKLTVMTE